ncbi:hypothetical protein HDU67_003941, partial [Dinochytrium kinnereticum]
MDDEVKKRTSFQLLSFFLPYFSHEPPKHNEERDAMDDMFMETESLTRDITVRLTMSQPLPIPIPRMPPSRERPPTSTTSSTGVSTTQPQPQPAAHDATATTRPATTSMERGAITQIANTTRARLGYISHRLGGPSGAMGLQHFSGQMGLEGAAGGGFLRDAATRLSVRSQFRTKAVCDLRCRDCMTLLCQR